MVKPLLSIVVPTKDRYKYLKYLINYVVEWDNPLVELVIQDNTAENKEILEYLSNISSDSIKYFHYGTPISICENSDKAVLNSKGEYVCYIGDDDSFLLQIVSAVQLMKEKNIDVLIPNRIYYFWPDITSDSIYRNPIFMPIPTGIISNVDPITELKKCLSSVGRDIINLPHLYHGIVRRDFLNKIFEKVSTFFPGPSPDMANAVALCLIGGNIIKIDYPLIIAGTGFKRIENNERGDFQAIEKCSFLPPETIKNWNERIPKVWTLPTIYAQTLYITLKNMEYEFLWKNFDYTKLYSLVDEIISQNKNAENRLNWWMNRELKYYLKKMLPRPIAKFLNRIKIPQNIPDVVNYTRVIEAILPKIDFK